MGTSLYKIRLNSDSSSDKKKKKKNEQRINFTGRKMLREEDLAEIDDMNPEEIRSLLVN